MQKSLHSKWTFRVKQDRKYKTKLVVKDEQRNQLDYQETYSPVIDQNAMRNIMTIVIAKDYYYKILIFLCQDSISLRRFRK